MSEVPEDVRRRSEELLALEAERIAIHQHCEEAVNQAFAEREAALAALQERFNQFAATHAGQIMVGPEVLSGKYPYVSPEDWGSASHPSQETR